MKLPTFTDSRGSLTVIEDCPFEIKRVFWIYDVPEDELRAGHSHDLCEQALVCVSGSVIVAIEHTITILDSPDKIIYVPKGRFITLFRFSKDAVLLF